MSRQIEKLPPAVTPVGADYVTRIVTTPHEINPAAWNHLLSLQVGNTPFMRHEYLTALHDSECATSRTGWEPHFLLLQQGEKLVAGCPVYTKHHSHGEYVFDGSWAQAYRQYGQAYYPKAVVAVPFTPVPGVRLLASTGDQRALLIRALIRWSQRQQLSSLHLLFAGSHDIAVSLDANLLQRQTVQFHWRNNDPSYADFDAFLSTLTQAKRKNIRQERRKVADAGVRFRTLHGRGITQPDWDFFYRCYERTYLEHGQQPYLNRQFFYLLGESMAENWVLFVAERGGKPIAASLIAVSDGASQPATAARGSHPKVAYGRYWGAIERVDCLHFEACYYQPIQWCIAHGFARFEGGAQGEHKMARALMPTITQSAHWIAEPAFSDAIGRALEREAIGIRRYLDDLTTRSPLKNACTPS